MLHIFSTKHGNILCTKHRKSLKHLMAISINLHHKCLVIRNRLNFQIRKCQLNAEDTRNLLMCFTWVLKNVDKSVLRHWWTDMPINRLNCILEIIYFAVSNFEYRVYSYIYHHSSLQSYAVRILKSGTFLCPND